MRKACLLLVFVFLVGIVGIGFAQVEEKRAELEKVREYIKVLDGKIEKARAARKINKLAELKELKRKELKRARLLKAEIARLERKKPKVAPRKIERKARFQAAVGYGGGAGMVSAGYALPVMPDLDILLTAGLGIGNKYTVIAAEAAGIFPFGNNYAGLELGLANYSEKVTGVLGLSGNIEKGSRAGVGVFVGTKIGMVNAQVGYNSALGLRVEAVYKF